jgi:ABC-type bacteriocin/lantibiotic exporter with double-glycine peptidase domain
VAAVTRDEGGTGVALLEARGLWFACPGGGPEAVRGATLSVERGRLSAVVGANGSRKSPLVRLLAGLLKVSRGEVLFDGAPLDSL